MARGIYFLNKFKLILPEKLKLLIYNAHVHSHLEFIYPYLPMAKKSTRDKVIRCQKRAIRALANISYNAHTAHVFRNLKIMPISYLCELNIYRLIKGIKLSNMNTNFIDYWPTNREGNIRSSLPNNIAKLAKRLTLLERTPFHFAAEIYNQHSSIFKNLPFDKVRELFLDKYVTYFACKGVGCFTCTSESAKFPHVENQREFRKKVSRRVNR